MIKFQVINPDECSFGIQYNQETNILSVGGHKRFILTYEECLETFAAGKKYKLVKTATNKIQLRIPLSLADFSAGIRKIKDSELTILQRSSLGRMMR